MKMPRSRTLSHLLLLFLTLGLALPTVGQEPTAPPAEPEQEQQEPEQQDEDASEKEEAKKKPAVEFGVQLRWRSEFRDNSDFQLPNDFDQFVGQRARINLKFNLHDRLSFFFQPQDVWLYGAESDKIIHELGTNLHQAYLDWTMPRGDEITFVLRLGRQEFNYGKQRLVGGFAWDNVGRSFDGTRLRYESGLGGGIDGFWGRLVDVRRRGNPRRPGNLDIGGVVLRVQQDKGEGTPDMEIYWSYLRDSYATGGETGLTPENTGISTLGFRLERTPDPTGILWELENQWQHGSRGPDGHKAMMLVGNGGYIWDAPLKPLLKVEYAYASGDNDGADGKSREFHNLFPTNHLHYGYADREGLRNLHNIRVTSGWQLLPKVRFETDVHKFLLAAKRGAWKNAGGGVLGFDPTGTSGRDVGQEIDFTLRLPFWKHVKLMGGYSVFFPGAFAKATRGPETHHWGFVQTVVSF